MSQQSQDQGASAQEPTGLSPTVEPLTGLDGSATSIPSAEWFARVAADWCAAYLTAGKLYPVLDEGELGFSIAADDGDKIYCLWIDSAHLDGGNWERVPAQGIEARQGGDGEAGSIGDESPVPKACAQTPSGEPA